MGEAEKRASGRERGNGGGCALLEGCVVAQCDTHTEAAVSPLSPCRHLDIHTVYPAVCSEARLAAGTKVLIRQCGCRAQRARAAADHAGRR